MERVTPHMKWKKIRLQMNMIPTLWEKSITHFLKDWNLNIQGVYLYVVELGVISFFILSICFLQQICFTFSKLDNNTHQKKCYLNAPTQLKTGPAGQAHLLQDGGRAGVVKQDWVEDSIHALTEMVHDGLGGGTGFLCREGRDGERHKEHVRGWDNGGLSKKTAGLPPPQLWGGSCLLLCSWLGWKHLAAEQPCLGHTPGFHLRPSMPQERLKSSPPELRTPRDWVTSSEAHNGPMHELEWEVGYPGWTREYNPRSGKEARRIPSLCTHIHTEDLPPGAHHPSLGKAPRPSGWGSQSRENSSKIRVRPLTQEAAGRTDLSRRSGRSTDVGSVDREALSQPESVSRFSHVQLFATPQTVACQTPLSMSQRSLDLNPGTVPFSAVWPWVSDSTSSCLRSVICKMGLDQYKLLSIIFIMLWEAVGWIRAWTLERRQAWG